MGYKFWSEEEDARLFSAYQANMSLPEIAALFPDRTPNSVTVHASKIGASDRSWTPEEDEILSEIWKQPRALKVGLSRLPKRTYDAARIRAQSIGLGPKQPVQKGSRSDVFKFILEDMRKNGPRTARELSKALGIKRRRAQRILHDCRGHDFHVGGWKMESSHHPAMVWALGPGEDVPKPSPKSQSTASRDYKARKRIKRGTFNPFATAAGLVQAPQGSTGRVFKQDMDIDEWGQSREAA